MTSKEIKDAIEIFETLEVQVPIGCKRDFQVARYLAIEALEKQIPKKPICVEDKMWSCPVCYNNLLHKWIKYPIKLMPKTEGFPHCMSCGQAIDWSEEE